MGTGSFDLMLDKELLQQHAQSKGGEEDIHRIIEQQTPDQEMGEQPNTP